LFAEENVSHPMGFENIRSIEEVVTIIEKILQKKPGVPYVLVKLNEGVSGEGNAVVNLEGVNPNDSSAILSRLRQMRFELAGITFDSYAQKLKDRGGIVEEMIRG